MNKIKGYTFTPEDFKLVEKNKDLVALNTKAHKGMLGTKSQEIYDLYSMGNVDYALSKSNRVVAMWVDSDGIQNYFKKITNEEAKAYLGDDDSPEECKSCNI